MNLKLITLETSTDACSCALYVDGEIMTQSQMAPRQHTHLILPMMDTLLNHAGLTPKQLDAIAFGRGPGSFTGLRIACSVAQAVSFANNIPAIPVSSLAILAQAAHIKYKAKKVLAMLDARMGEVYWGKYIVDQAGIMQCDGIESVSIPDKIEIPTSDGWYGIGTGWNIYKNRFDNQLIEKPDNYPQADAIVSLAISILQTGQATNAENALPIYLRDQVVQRQKI